MSSLSRSDGDNNVNSVVSLPFAPLLSFPHPITAARARVYTCQD